MSTIETVNRPVRFTGTEEQRVINRATHSFVYYEDESECMDCCCKPWHVAADYPCGQEPPRETLTFVFPYDPIQDSNDAEREDH